MSHRIIRLLPIFAAQAALILSCAADELAPESGDQGWKEVSKKPGLVIYCREKKDSAVKEYKAVGDIDAPAWGVKNVIDDVDGYAHFMPYITESSVVSREAGSLITYQRFSGPLISDRDYILRIQYESHPAATGGTVYCNKWKAVSGYGPAEKPGVIRVKVNEGYWLIEPVGETTRATYMIFTDPGGTIPAMMVNYANKNAIPKLFLAVQKQAADKKYRDKMPQAGAL